ncbi:MAG: amino acid ABC transporter substrate-binding protein, partial [Candidimonas sp.]
MKFMPLVLAAAVTVIGMTAAQAEGRLDKIKSSGEITLGYRDASIPFSYL